jgi:chromosome segregation ATPase
MSEEPTKDLSDGRTFEERVMAEFAAIRAEQAATRRDIAALDTRLTAVEQRLVTVEQRLATVEQRLVTLEDRVDARLRETRPIWEAVQASLERLDEKFDNVIRDLYDVRTDIGLHDKRLKEIERRLNS